MDEMEESIMVSSDSSQTAGKAGSLEWRLPAAQQER
jgi:hypothetical protein